MVTRRQIINSVERGAAWLKSRQNEDGSYGKWNPGSTALAIMALLGSNVSGSDPAIADAVTRLLDSELSDSTFFRSFTVMALVTYGDKSPDILKRVHTDVEWLHRAQCSDPADTFSFGGWGHSGYPLLADGSNTQHALLALYKAAGWGLDVPREVLRRALAWYRRNHDVNKDGSCFYSLKNKIQFNRKDVIYSMTSGVLNSMKIINELSPDPGVKSEAQYLFDRAWHWLSNNYDIELNPDASDSWRYYYLYSLKNGCSMNPASDYIGKHDWYNDIAGYLVSRQEADGGWSSKGEKESTRIIYTGFALITLSRDLITAASSEADSTSHSGQEKTLKEYIFGDNGQKSTGGFEGYIFRQQDTTGEEELVLHNADMQDTGGEEPYGAEKGTSENEEQNKKDTEITCQTAQESSGYENKIKLVVIKQNPDGKWVTYISSDSIEPGNTNDDLIAPPENINDAPANMISDNDWKESVEDENYSNPVQKHDIIHLTVNAGDDTPKEYDLSHEHDIPEDKEEKYGTAWKTPLQTLVGQFWTDNTGHKNSGKGSESNKPWYTQIITGPKTYESEVTGSQRPDETTPVHPLDAFIKSLWGAKK